MRNRQSIQNFEFAIEIYMLISFLIDLLQLQTNSLNPNLEVYGIGFIALVALKIHYEGCRLILLIQIFTNILIMISKFLYHKDRSLLLATLIVLMLSFILMIAMPIYQTPPLTGLYNVGYKEQTIEGITVNIFYPVDKTIHNRRKQYIKHVRGRKYVNELYDHFKDVMPFRAPLWVYQLVLGHLYFTKMEVYKDVQATEEISQPKAVLFSNGLGGLVNHYSSICRELASQGHFVFGVQSDEKFIVISKEEIEMVRKGLAHKDNDMGLAILHKIEAARKQQLVKRVQDNKLVLEKVLDPSYMQTLFGRSIKFHEVFGAGHSFGAATVYQTAIEDRRMRGGLIMYDAYLLPLPDESLVQTLNIPMVFINSETFKHRPYNDTIPRLQKVLKKEKHSTAIDLLGSEHQSQCDLVFFMPFEMYLMREIRQFANITDLCLLNLKITNLFVEHRLKEKYVEHIEKFCKERYKKKSMYKYFE